MFLTELILFVFNHMMPSRLYMLVFKQVYKYMKIRDDRVLENSSPVS